VIWDQVGCVIVIALVAVPYVAGAVYVWRNPPSAESILDA
jgi:hypothetical protein